MACRAHHTDKRVRLFLNHEVAGWHITSEGSYPNTTKQENCATGYNVTRTSSLAPLVKWSKPAQQARRDALQD